MTAIQVCVINMAIFIFCVISRLPVAIYEQIFHFL